MRTRPADRRPWTLRRQLVSVVALLVVAVCAVLAVTSALALRSELVNKLDSQLIEQSRRSANFHGGEVTPGQTTAPLPSALLNPSPAPGSTTSTIPLIPQATRGPLDAPGLAAGTISAVIRDGQVVFAGYIDENGSRVELTPEQQAVLVSIPADGTLRTVSLGSLGSYRVLGTETTRGDTLVSAASLTSTSSTVQSYVLTELVVAAIGVLLAVFTGMVLVRRSLRPLERVAATATRVSEIPLSRGEVTIGDRVDVADTDPRTEVGRVGSALNLMLGHVENALSARHESETQLRQFLADASHELRTPLASIRGYTELVRRLPDALPEGAVHALERVQAESLRMSALVEDMLLLARLDAGRELEHGDVDMVALALDAVADAHAAGPDHAWRLELPGADDETVEGALPGVVAGEDVPDDVDLGSDTGDDIPPALVHGDDNRLRQVLVNLLSNARAHTPAGTTVTVAVRREDDEVVIEVTDDGPGIPAELLPNLFQRFTRGDSSRNRVGGSTGLGLAIAHAVVQAHHGTITAASTPGHTLFTVRLPAA
ncbi:MAG TPA: HAMP domain-containing sensor histidine kinase [Cellulomonadaceae bacterium]|nr:HAMP domain-containing sensor histidine kinase [Cellulomonadaceae bacterium]